MTVKEEKSRRTEREVNENDKFGEIIKHRNKEDKDIKGQKEKHKTQHKEDTKKEDEGRKTEKEKERRAERKKAGLFDLHMQSHYLMLNDYTPSCAHNVHTHKHTRRSSCEVCGTVVFLNPCGCC